MQVAAQAAPLLLAGGNQPLPRTLQVGGEPHSVGGHAGLVLPRSGLAARHGIALVNAPGLIDEGYRGEVQVLLLNTDRHASFAIAPGDRIAQLLLVRVETPEVVEVDDLAPSERAASGFGSSGR